MTQPIVYVDTSEVRVGKLNKLKLAMNDLVHFVEVNEPRLLAYNVYFTDDDTPASPRVAIVNDAFVESVFGGASPIGRTFQIEGAKGQPDGPAVEIVGRVANTKYSSLRETFPPIAYLAAEDAEPGRILEHEETARLRSAGLARALESLDARSRRIIEARWLGEKESATLHELADEFGVSAERVRQIEAKALGKMKGVIEARAG